MTNKKKGSICNPNYEFVLLMEYFANNESNVFWNIFRSVDTTVPWIPIHGSA